MHTPATSAQLRRIFIFAGAYIFLSLAGALASGNFEFLFYLATMALIITGLMLVHRRVGLSAGLLWSLAIWGLLHMIGGLVPIPEDWHRGLETGVVYNLWIVPGYLKYDQLVHAYGFGITTLLCWQALSARVLDDRGQPLRPTPGLMVLCAAGGMGFGALNEVIEFFASITLPKTNVGGYLNTGWDLVANLIGASLAAVCIFIYDRK